MLSLITKITKTCDKTIEGKYCLAICSSPEGHVTHVCMLLSSSSLGHKLLWNKVLAPFLLHHPSYLHGGGVTVPGSILQNFLGVKIVKTLCGILKEQFSNWGDEI